MNNYNNRPTILPRRIIGPDNIKALRDFSRELTGDRFAFDNCRVQRNRFGGPAIDFDLNTLEVVGKGHPDSYGVLIRHLVIPEAERLAEALCLLPEEDRKTKLSNLLRKARREDSTAWWLLSTAALRSLLFPDTYHNGRRSDGVIYLNHPNDFHRGKAVTIGNLSPSAVDNFTSYAQRMINKPVDPKMITPLQ